MIARKSFILHLDSLAVLDELSDEQAGILFKAIKAYQDGEEMEMDTLTKVAFTPFRNQFNRDLEKYERICERNKNNGNKGGRPKETQKNPEEPKKPSGLSGITEEPRDNPKEPKKPDSKSDSKSKSDSDSDSKNESKSVSENDSDRSSKDISPTAPVSKPKKSTSYTWPKPEGVGQQDWADWLAVRKAKRLPISQSVMNKIQSEADKACLSLPDVIKRCASEPWAGFKASWLNNAQVQGAQSNEPDHRYDTQAALDSVEATGRAYAKSIGIDFDTGQPIQSNVIDGDFLSNQI